MHLHAGAAVWVRRPSAAASNGTPAVSEWAAAVVQTVDDTGCSAVVRFEDGTESPAQASDIELRGNDEEVQDLIRLSYLNEPSVLASLARRYTAGDIYTKTGTGIIIAINPFKQMPHLYDTPTMDFYREEGSGADLAGPRPPHVFATASKAYWHMRREGKGQALLVTGESGAGKTETSKLLMKYLAYLGGYKQQAADDDEDSSRLRVEQRVLESNPLLEAFGNAKTVRNDNSSRFGKYIELHFCAAGSISGARIHTYLLERSRLVAPSKGERNYHIFYQLLAGATPEERARWRLGGDASAHRLTSMAGCLSLPGVDDAKELSVTRHAMRSVKIGPEEQDQIFRLLAGLLNLGDVDFAACTTESGEEGCQVAPGGEAALAAVAELFGCDAGALGKAMTTRTRVTPDGPIVSPLAAKAAAETRDALSKVVYARMFDWLVARINAAVGEDPSRASTIGLLDIYGFESFAFNDLEQFCINLANEKLQQHFNHNVFKQEQDAYAEEGIDWSYIEFVDNQDVLDLIEGRMGLMDLIDEACRFPTATPKDLAEKLLSGSLPLASPRFSRAKKSTTAFTISHYAGPVTYQTDHMLDKNRDFVISEHQALLAGSSVPLAAQLFGEEAPALAPAGPSSGALSRAGSSGLAKGSQSNLKGFQFVSVGSQFKRQLGELAAKLAELQPHYVRCIKPNPKNKSMELEAAYALDQLRCGGVMEAVRISNAGYPFRKRFDEFVNTFWPVAPGLLGRPMERRPRSSVGARVDESARAAAVSLLRAMSGEGEAAEGPLLREGADWQMGKTMVFMRAGATAALARLQTRANGVAATRVQAAWRGARARREARDRRAAILAVQTLARGALVRRDLNRIKYDRAARELQCSWRARAARGSLARTRAAAVVLQRAWRGCAARILAKKVHREKLMARRQAEWRFYATRGAAAMLRATASLQMSQGSQSARHQADAKPKMRRFRAATRIQTAWRLHKLASSKYREEHYVAACVIQDFWRNRGELRSEVRVARLRNGLIEYAARWHAAVIIQSTWRGHRAYKRLHKIREARRREEFKKNAAMFESMAVAAGGKLPTGSALPVASAVRINANGRVNGASQAPRGEDGEEEEVVKADTTPSLPDKGARLHNRGVVDLKEKAKVTSLLGIWQHRLQSSQQRQLAKLRQERVWQRQQQLLRQHQQQHQHDQDDDMVLLSPQSSEGSLIDGPPRLF